MPVTVVRNNLPAIATALRQQVADATLKTAAWIERDVKKQMHGPKHGKAYHRGAITKKFKLGGKKWKEYSGMKATFSGGSVKVTTGYKFHRASAPGEAPAVDTAKLINSIESEQIGEVDAAAYSTSAYSAHLEFGTVKMAARPAFTPSAFRAIEFLTRMVSRILRHM